ncbi:MATE family efflux transporter [Metabacillus niabensis]|uniref:MATE family efflux transporter n=1 Tax=Metabacillus niabensis TaxID=324854 RepID=UPI001CFA66DB|nr:MATE family efflux transporter [Metabacillus niabensis]
MNSKATSVQLESTKEITHRNYLLLAIPLIIAGISTPLLGAVDTAVVGRLPEPTAIGAVSVSAVIFNTMYWLLGFLRVGTTGLTSQASGANNEKEIVYSFIRPLFVAILIGCLFIFLQIPILKGSLYLFGASQTLEELTSTYFSIRIWGAPFALINYVLIGWLMGIGKVRLSLATQISMNLVNIVLDLLFVLVFGWGVAGVALATVIAETSTVIIGLFFVVKSKQLSSFSLNLFSILQKEPIIRMLIMNRDLFLRAVCLLLMTGIFTTIGARMGEIELAANAILLQVHYIMAYLLSGFANASSILVGRSIGSNNQSLYNRTLTLSLRWGLSSAICLSLLMVLFGNVIIMAFTSIEEVKNLAVELFIWMAVYPIVAFWGLQLEGVFSGATEAKFIRNSIFYALILFIFSIWLFGSTITPHELWFSFHLFTFGRSLFLSLSLKRLSKLKFSS